MVSSKYACLLSRAGKPALNQPPNQPAGQRHRGQRWSYLQTLQSTGVLQRNCHIWRPHTIQNKIMESQGTSKITEKRARSWKHIGHQEILGTSQEHQRKNISPAARYWAAAHPAAGGMPPARASPPDCAQGPQRAASAGGRCAGTSC